MQVLWTEQTIPDAEDGSGHSGFRGAIAQALSSLNLNGAGGSSSATVLDFTFGDDGTMKLDAASARDIDNANTTAELVTRVQEEVDRRDALKKRDAPLCCVTECMDNICSRSLTDQIRWMAKASVDPDIWNNYYYFNDPKVSFAYDLAIATLCTRAQQDQIYDAVHERLPCYMPKTWGRFSDAADRIQTFKRAARKHESASSQPSEPPRPPPPPPPPPVIVTPQNPHRLGDRLLVFAGLVIRTRVRVTNMKFDEHTGRHLVSLLEVMWSENRKLFGKHLSSNDVAAVGVLEDFKGEWQRVAAHARIVGKAGAMLRARFDNVHEKHKKHEKEAAKRLRETAPRRCRECDTRRPRDDYSASQWNKPEGRRTCTPCQDAAKAKAQRARDEAARLEMEDLLNSECAVCYDEAIAPDDRAIFACAHWICRDCASQLHLRNELHACPHCRHPILDPQQHVAARL